MASRTGDPWTKERLASRELRGGFWDKAKERASSNAFSRTGLAHEPKRFTFADLEAHTVDREYEPSLCGESNAKPSDGKQRETIERWSDGSLLKGNAAH